MAQSRRETESQIHQLCLERRYKSAVEDVLVLYGTEIYRFTRSLVRQEALAEDAYAAFCEYLVRGLPGFQWRSSLRLWLYRVARNASYRTLNAIRRGEEPVGTLEDDEQLMAVERTRTCTWRRTEVKEKFRALREQLSTEERLLLRLRLDQRLSWNEVARLMVEPDEEEPSAEELARRAAALRQKYQRLKEQLRTLAQSSGLIAAQ